MLNINQVKFLAKIAKLDTYEYGDVVVGVGSRQHISACISYPYEDFKQNMGLSDIRFDWLLTDKVFLAGGSVLNWVWGETKNEDIDFFFTNADSASNFRALIGGYGFVETNESRYAMTCFNEEEGVIIQIVGSDDQSGRKDEKIFNGFIPFDTPQETIKRFDIGLCKFAVDGDNVYFTVGAAVDLITKTINNTGEKYNTKERTLKYNRKGFFIPNIEEQPNNVSSGWY